MPFIPGTAIAVRSSRPNTPAISPRVCAGGNLNRGVARGLADRGAVDQGCPHSANHHGDV